MQLSSIGSQDAYLTGNPQITFFKSVYYRHTNYSMESVEYSFDGNEEFGNELTTTITKNGDLLYRSYLEVSLNAPGSAWEPYVGHVMIKKISIYIGNELIDSHTGEWLNTWGELTTPQSKWRTYQGMIGYPQENNTSAMKLYIPLQFWFCRRLGSALPICSLQHQDIRIVLTLRASSEVMGTGVTGKIDYIKLYIDNIYLDSQERRRFSDNNHEYLIEQVQFNGESKGRIVASATKECELTFNNPIKEIIWTVRQNGKKLFEYTEEETMDNVDSGVVLKFNGIERFPIRPGKYFSFVQPYQHHTRSPAGEITGSDNNLPLRNEPANSGKTFYNKQIHVYSFAEKPEELQPTGTCNMSCIDRVTLNFTYDDVVDDSTIKIFAVNYNILRFMSGMCGIAFNN